MIEILETIERIDAMWTAQLGWWIGMFTCIAGALVGQAELIPEPYRHWVTIAFVAGTAASGFMIQRPAPKPAAEVEKV